MRFTKGWLLLLATCAFGQQYHSNDLTPPLATAAKLTSASKGKQVGSGANYHAYRLNGNALAATDLNPPGYSQSYATASDDASECGYGWGLTGYRALKWSGTGTAYTELQQPSGYNASFCLSTDNGQQGGFAQNLIYSVTVEHGMFWDAAGTANDLHPTTSGYAYSRVVGVKAGEQVGYVSQVPYPYGDAIGVYHPTSHAYRWTGTAASGTDMHPALFDASEITLYSSASR